MTRGELVASTEVSTNSAGVERPDAGRVFLEVLLRTFGAFLKVQYPDAWSAAAARTVRTRYVDPEATKAARILGVHADASADEIRAALRAKIVAGRIHPDAGGDADQARRLIDAKNFLIERARAVQQ